MKRIDLTGKRFVTSERKCPVCGGALPPRRMKYCSDQCREEAEKQKRRALTGGRKGPMIKSIICPDCGKEALVYTKSYRCPECQKEADARANAEHKRRKRAGKTRELGSTDICQRCGKAYTVEGGLQKYCKDCAAEVMRDYKQEKALAYYHDRYDQHPEEKAKRREKRRLPRYGTIICRVCGCEFIPETSHAVYCSPKCADEGHRIQSAQWRAEHKAHLAEYMRKFRKKGKNES